LPGGPQYFYPITDGTWYGAAFNLRVRNIHAATQQTAQTQGKSMKRSIRTAIATALASFCLCSGADAQLATFSIPGATFITPVGINDDGQLTGVYTDASGGHGFLRQPDGTLTTFDVPVAGTKETLPAGISAAGVITGLYEGSAQSGGFVRAADGTITTFTVPHARYGFTVGGMNAKGWSVGGYRRLQNAHGLFQSFLRRPSGKAAEFTVPGATGGSIATRVNNFQTVAGVALIWHKDHYQGFIRTADGTATVFGNPRYRVEVTGINDAGTISGWFQSNPFEGYIRTSDGALTTFLAPNGSKATYANAINNSGTIAGRAVDSDQVSHGYLRTADGKFKTVDPEGAAGTELLAINNKGVVAGDYVNADGAVFGFLGKP